MSETLEFLDPKTLYAIVAAIRKQFNNSSIEYVIAKHRALTDEIGPRGGKRFKCAHCNQSFGEGDIKIDHIQPVVPVDTPTAEMTLRMLYERCFCKVDNLQALCHSCHTIKSNDERKQRSKFKQLKKPKPVKVKKLRVA